MAIGLLFWILMLFWLVFGFWTNMGNFRSGNYYPFGGNLLLFVLLVILGWAVFGAAIKA